MMKPYMIVILFILVFNLNLSTSNKIKELGSNEAKNLTKYLPDFNNDKQTERTEFQAAFRNHKMRPVEVSNIFSLADINKDGALNKEEWGYFYKIFIEIFQKKCDYDHDYLLTEDELWRCIKKDKEYCGFLQDTELPLDDDEKLKPLPKEIISILAPIQKKLNFADYIFFRRAAMGWRDCVAADKLSSSTFRCAIQAGSSGKEISASNSAMIFKMANIQNGLPDQSAEYTFTEFLRVLYSWNIFTFFDVPITDGAVDKMEFKQAISEGQLPGGMSDAMIEQLYEASDPGNPKAALNYPSFVILTMFYGLFVKHGNGKPFVDKDQFCALISEKILYNDVMINIDKSHTEIDHKFWEEAAPKFLPTGYDEHDFLYNKFLQISTKTKPKSK